MSNILIGFSAANSFIAKAIRILSRSEVNHTFIRFYDSTLDTYFVMESSWYGYRVIPYNKFLSKTIIKYEFECKIDLSDGIKWSAQFLTNKYDWISAIWLVFSKIIKNPIKSVYKWNCTEAVARILQHAGLAEELNVENIWPKDLLAYCKSNENFILK